MIHVEEKRPSSKVLQTLEARQQRRRQQRGGNDLCCAPVSASWSGQCSQGGVCCRACAHLLSGFSCEWCGVLIVTLLVGRSVTVIQVQVATSLRVV